jgi:hypothetical protein
VMLSQEGLQLAPLRCVDNQSLLALQSVAPTLEEVESPQVRMMVTVHSFFIESMMSSSILFCNNIISALLAVFTRLSKCGANPLGCGACSF